MVVGSTTNAKNVYTDHPHSKDSQRKGRTGKREWKEGENRETRNMFGDGKTNGACDEYQLPRPRPGYVKQQKGGSGRKRGPIRASWRVVHGGGENCMNQELAARTMQRSIRDGQSWMIGNAVDVSALAGKRGVQ